MDYHKLNQGVSPTAASIPDAVLLLDQMNTSFDVSHIDTYLVNAFKKISTVSKDQQKQFSFHWQGQLYTFTVLPQRQINSPVLCHNLVCRDFGQLSLPQDITSHVFMLSHFNHVWLFVTLWTVACQAPLSMGFSR